MPRTPRNPGSGKLPVNTPARGTGWGGEAGGYVHSPPNHVERLAQLASAGSRAPGYRALERTERVEALRQILWDIATNPKEPTQNRILAADKCLDREEGKPVQKVVTAEAGQGWYIEGVAKEISSESWEQTAQLAISKPAGSAD